MRVDVTEPKLRKWPGALLFFPFRVNFSSLSALYSRILSRSRLSSSDFVQLRRIDLIHPAQVIIND